MTTSGRCSSPSSVCGAPCSTKAPTSCSSRASSPPVDTRRHGNTSTRPRRCSDASSGSSRRRRCAAPAGGGSPMPRPASRREPWPHRCSSQAAPPWPPAPSTPGWSACAGPPTEREQAGDEHLEAACLFELGAALVHAVRSHDDEGAVAAAAQRRPGRVARRPPSGRRRLSRAGLRRRARRAPAVRRHPPAGRPAACRRRRPAAGRDRQRRTRSTSPTGVITTRRSPSTAQPSNGPRQAANHRRVAWSLGLGSWAHLRVGDLDRAADWARRCLALVADTTMGVVPALAAGRACRDRPGRRSRPARRSAMTSTTPSPSAAPSADPCWEGATARAIALDPCRRRRTRRALEWIDQSRRRCLRETDTYVAVHAAILDTEATISAAAGQQARADAAGRALVALAARCHICTRTPRQEGLHNGAAEPIRLSAIHRLRRAKQPAGALRQPSPTGRGQQPPLDRRLDPESDRLDA